MRFSGPTYAYIQVSRQCGGCALDCYAAPDGQSLSLKEAKQIADILWDAKVFIVLIDGGEPLLWDGIPELVAHFRSKPMAVGIVSGAEDISQAEALKKADLSMIQFPVEGPEEYHDTIRGEGSFQRSMDAIKTFCDLDIYTHVGTVVTPSNLLYIEDISHTLTQFPIRIHRLIRYIHPHDYLNSDQCMTLLSTAYQLNMAGRPIMPNNCYTFVKHTPYAPKIDFDRFQGCVGGNTSAVITCDGYVVPCPHFASRKIAESIDAPVIWDVNLSTIWKDWDFAQKFRKGLKACQECPDVVMCGGCRAAAYCISGKLDRDPGCPITAEKG
jgi:radical SAM protein with 4Fe4S-binding SPASM domain